MKFQVLFLVAMALLNLVSAQYHETMEERHYRVRHLGSMSVSGSTGGITIVSFGCNVSI